MRTRFIVNPMANKGGCGKRWPEIRSTLERALGKLPDDAIAFTKARGHAGTLAREAVADGYERLVSLGGDGTFNEMLNGLIVDDRPVAQGLVLAQVPCGTSNELSRSFDHLDIDRAGRALASGRTRAIDVFRADAVGPDGGAVKRYGFLLAIVGAPATISWRAQRVPLLKRLGPVAYVIMTALTTLSYRPRITSVAYDNEAAVARPVWGVMLCSFAGAGEGLLLAPGADPGDGRLDIVELGNFGRFEALTKIVPKLGDGSYVNHAKIARRVVTKLRMDSSELVRADVDGESIGRLPMTVQLLPFRIDVATT